MNRIQRPASHHAERNAPRSDEEASKVNQATKTTGTSNTGAAQPSPSAAGSAPVPTDTSPLAGAAPSSAASAPRPTRAQRAASRRRALHENRHPAQESEAAARRFEAKFAPTKTTTTPTTKTGEGRAAAAQRPFVAAQVAAEVHDALDRAGRPDVSKLMQHLGGRSLAEVQAVERAYNDHYLGATGRDFRSALLAPFAADTAQGKAVRALLAGDPATADAHALHHFAEAGIKGRLGVDAAALQDMLRQRTPEQRAALLAAHRETYGQPLTDYLHAQHVSSKERKRTEALLLRPSGVGSPPDAAAAKTPATPATPATLAGRVAQLEQAFGAWHGTHVERTLGALGGMTPAESRHLQAAWAARHPGSTLADEFKNRLSGRNELRATTLLEGQRPLFDAAGRASPEGVAHRLAQAQRWVEAESGGIAAAFTKDDDILRHTVGRAERAVQAGDWQEAARLLRDHLPHDLAELVQTKESAARTAATAAGVGIGALAVAGTGGLALPALASTAAAMGAAGAGAGLAHKLTDPHATGRELFQSSAVGAVGGAAAGVHAPLAGKLVARGLSPKVATTAVGAGVGGAEGFASTLLSGGRLDEAARDALLSALSGGAMSGAAAPIEARFARFFGARGGGGTGSGALASGGEGGSVRSGTRAGASAPDAIESALGLLREGGHVAALSDDQVRVALRDIRRRWNERDGSLPDAHHLEVMHALQALAREP